jgi:hypothetical protein
LSWLFKNFVSDRGENEIRRWIDALPKKVKFKIDTRIKYLQEVDQLKFPYVEKWVGEDDLYEVRITFGVQYRILGCYGEQRREFLLLIGAIEKDWKLEPKNAVDIAKSRMKLISNRSNFCDHFEKEEN